MSGWIGHPEVVRIMDRQQGLITRTQCLDVGMTPEYLSGLVRRGVLVLVRRGVYMPVDRWQALDPYVGQQRIRARAAHLQLRRAHVLSHDSSALELEIPMLRVRHPLVHVTRRGVRGGRVEHGIKHHLAPFRPEQVLQIDGVPVLDRARTAVDLAREHGLTAGVVACDAVRQQGATLSDLWAAAAPMTSWPQVTVVRAAIERSDAGAESIAETLARLLLEEIGIGPVETQFELADLSRRVRCDLRVHRHMFEVDGATKYLPTHRGGLARDPSETLWQEKQRQDWLVGYRLGISRLVWADLWGERRAQTKTRLLREYRATCAAYGTDIADLAPIIVRRSA